MENVIGSLGLRRALAGAPQHSCVSLDAFVPLFDHFSLVWLISCVTC